MGTVSQISQLFGIIIIASSCVNNYSFDQSVAPEASALSAAAPSPTPSFIGETSNTLRTYKPALAVRGAQCMVCHASIQSNIITDFGFGGPNFAANQFNQTNVFTDVKQIGATVHHSNESAFTNQREAWQKANGIDGQIIVPKAIVTDTQLEVMTGTRQSISLKDLLEHPNLTGNGSMVSKVTIPAGATEKVVEKEEVVISYPTETEVLDLLPASRRGDVLAVYEKTLVGALPSVASHFILDTGRGVVRNDFTSPTLICRGDVVIKGTLLLKSATILTDKNGCRLYVSEGVHIQGGLTLQGPFGETPNLQISSATAILVGFSGNTMGGYTTGGRGEVFSETGNFLGRFAVRLDVMYNPSGASINGVAPATFFNHIVSEAMRLGDYLLDAQEAVTNGHVPTGATVVNGRLAYNYKGILLNAPHIHSRYYGDFQGAVIADVAFLARNPAGQALEKFIYDPVFDTAPAVLPALMRDMLRIK